VQIGERSPVYLIAKVPPEVAISELIGDCIEIYLMPDKEHPETGFQFVINSSGALWDARHPLDKFLDLSWNSSARTVIKIEKDRWIVKIANPMAEVSLTPGQERKANFYRSHVVDEGQTYLCWSPVLRENHFTPERFGTLIIQKKQD